MCSSRKSLLSVSRRGRTSAACEISRVSRAQALLSTLVLLDVLSVRVRQFIAPLHNIYDTRVASIVQQRGFLNHARRDLRPVSLFSSGLPASLFDGDEIHWHPRFGSTSCAIISRFILHLRHTDHQVGSVESRTSRPTLLQFHIPTIDDLVGDMGQPPDLGLQQPALLHDDNTDFGSTLTR